MSVSVHVVDTAIANLLLALNSDEGVDSQVYLATYNLIQERFGDTITKALILSVNATDGRFYFRDGMMRDFLNTNQNVPLSLKVRETLFPNGVPT